MQCVPADVAVTGNPPHKAACCAASSVFIGLVLTVSTQARRIRHHQQRLPERRMRVAKDVYAELAVITKVLTEKAGLDAQQRDGSNATRRLGRHGRRRGCV